MQINNTPNQQNTRTQKAPNFKGISIVQVPKKVFNNPENLNECSRVFEKEVRKFTNNKLYDKFVDLLSRLTGMPHKICVFLESPSYTITKMGM